jgi:catechol 2,3-dioxygenase-like lactoylglutathione lyase family enzyme
MTVKRYTHLSVTVADLGAARRYFVDGLGFKPIGQHRSVAGELGNTVAKLLELDEFEARLELIERDKQVLSLVEYTKPAPVSGQRQPMNICGSSHLCFLVQDIDGVARSLEDLGGSTLHDTRISTDLPDGKPRIYMLCLSPDGGTRIELIETDGLPNT